jgi:phage terminase small subunit
MDVQKRESDLSVGGVGSGGARVGSGRKKKTDTERRLGGNAGRRAPRRPRASDASGVDVPPSPPKAPPALELIPAPAFLTDEQRAVWNVEAPHAVEQRTLTPATVAEFADFCKAVVIERKLLETIEKQGWTIHTSKVDATGNEISELKKHPLVSDHRQWLQRVEQKRIRFRLSPMGKELVPDQETPADPFSEFDDAGTPAAAVN